MTRSASIPKRFERRVPGVRYGLLDRLVGYHLRRAQIAIYEDFEAALGPLDMTPQRFAAMVVISANDGIAQGRLGRVLGIARSGVVQLVHGLQSRGWVTRDADGDDARAWLLSVTDEGAARLAAARRLVSAHDRRISQRLSAEERRVLVTLLERLGADESTEGGTPRP